jgi:hypothetical protein
VALPNIIVSRILSYVIDVSLSASLALLLLSLSLIDIGQFLFVLSILSFLIWSLSEFYNKGMTVGREIVLNVEVILSVFLSLVPAVLVSFFSELLVLPVFILSLIACFLISSFYDLEGVQVKGKIHLKDTEPKKVALRNIWKSIALFFYPLLFLDFILIWFTGKRVVDFAVSNEVKACKN